MPRRTAAPRPRGPGIATTDAPAAAATPAVVSLDPSSTTMQVTEINAQGLKREFQVLLAAQELEERLTNEQMAMLKDNIRQLQVVRLPSTFHKIQLMFPRACATQLLHFISAHDGVTCHEA